METRDKPIERTIPTEPIEVIKSDTMKNMVEAMNKHYEDNKNTIDEPIKIIEGGGPPLPPQALIGGDEPPKIGIPSPPPPPPPPPIFDPSKVPKKPKKPVIKK